MTPISAIAPVFRVSSSFGSLDMAGEAENCWKIVHYRVKLRKKEVVREGVTMDLFSSEY